MRVEANTLQAGAPTLGIPDQDLKIPRDFRLGGAEEYNVS
jgi:hypothetical protein